MISRKLKKIALDHPFPLVFATISGAHLYGFPSADSDYDLRGVHVLPLKETIGLEIGRETIQVEEIRDDLELDLVTHDAKKFFVLMLSKNGYVLEQLYSPLIVQYFAGTRRIKGNREKMYYQTSRSSLFRLC